MANVPLPKRVLALLLARRVSANYRRRSTALIDQGKGPFSGVSPAQALEISSGSCLARDGVTDFASNACDTGYEGTSLAFAGVR
jgi:hypothetical protein